MEGELFLRPNFDVIEGVVGLSPDHSMQVQGMDIHQCRPEELKALHDFWSKHRPAANRRNSRSEDLDRLRHETFGNPFSNGAGTSWLVWEENQLIAHLRGSRCPAYYHGKRVDACWWQGLFALPDSQGASRGDAAALLVLKLRAQPHAHAVLGTPGVESPVFKLYQRMQFHYWGAVPFFYLVVDGGKVLRNLSIFKRNRLLALGANAASGLYIPGKLLALSHWRPQRAVRSAVAMAWHCFPPEADSLWASVSGRYPLIFDRTARYLNWRYGDGSYERIGVFHDQRLVGWFVFKTTQMQDDKYFGNLRVGTLVDVLADPENDRELETVLSLAIEKLAANGVDLIVTNFSHQRFIRAATRVGFREGPSNYHFLTIRLRPVALGECHIARGDSDGDSLL